MTVGITLRLPRPHTQKESPAELGVTPSAEPSDYIFLPL